MASSPRTFAPDNVDKYFPSRDTSTRPSGIEKKKIEYFFLNLGTNLKFLKFSTCFIVVIKLSFEVF